MKIYTFAEQYEFRAQSHEDFLRLMWLGSFSDDPTLADYMQGLAYRIWVWEQHFLRVSSIEVFVADLIAVGVVRITETN